MEEISVCEMCGKNKASVFIKKNINGVTTEKHLCSKCAKILQEQNLMGDLFDTNVLADFFGLANEIQPQNKIRICKCGTTEQDVLENYKFGCAECYNTFRDIAKKFVEKLGGFPYINNNIVKTKTKSTMSNAQNTSEDLEIKDKKSFSTNANASELEILKNFLNEAIASEDYLKANEINAKIKKLLGKN